MKRCDDCRYNQEPEYNKPCVVYRDDCPLYQKEGDGMKREEAIKELSEMRTDAWTDTRQMEALAEGIKAIKAIEDIKAEIALYESDCMLSCPNNDDCRDCNNNMFGSIYRIIDKHIGGNAGEKN